MWPAFVASGEMPRCQTCDGLLKPDVVLFGEMLPIGTLLEAQSQADRCDVMLVAGSSLEIYPAAGLPMRARQHGADVILINYQPTDMDNEAAVVIQDDLAVHLPRIAHRVLELGGIPQP
jgi:NAD-dependent deacetylase